MTRRVRFRPEVEVELEEAIGWYEKRAPGLGAEFIRAVEATVSLISRDPQIFPIVAGQARRAVLRRFPYSLVYIDSDREVLIVACLHVRRHPQRWRERL